MERAADYLELARQAYAWANSARREQDRAALIDIAETWAAAAERAAERERLESD